MNKEDLKQFNIELTELLNKWDVKLQIRQDIAVTPNKKEEVVVEPETQPTENK